MGIFHILRIVAIVPLGIGMYFLFSYVDRLKPARSGFERFYEGINDITHGRQIRAAEGRALYGVQQDNWVTRLDRRLHYSGLCRRYRRLSTELFLVAAVLVLAVSLLVGLMIFDKWYWAFLGAFMVYLIIQAGLNRLCRIQYTGCGRQMLSFVNLVANHAASSDDLINVLERTAFELNEPLRGIILECCMGAKASGNVSEALKLLEDSVEYPFFKTVIRNLELAARNEANYSEIINECRILLQNNLENEKELEVIYQNGRNEFIGTIVAGIISIYVLATGILRMGMGVLLERLMSTAFGIFIIIYAVVIVFLGFYHVLAGGDR